MHGAEGEEILYIAREEGLTPAFEIPGIRAEPEFLEFLDEGAAEFCNINEFEMSDGNYRRMQEQGYELQEGHMSAVDGSKEAILEEMGDHERVYFCTSVFKDAAQHRNRLKRMAKSSAGSSTRSPTTGPWSTARPGSQKPVSTNSGS